VGIYDRPVKRLATGWKTSVVGLGCPKSTGARSWQVAFSSADTDF